MGQYDHSNTYRVQHVTEVRAHAVVAPALAQRPGRAREGWGRLSGGGWLGWERVGAARGVGRAAHRRAARRQLLRRAAALRAATGRRRGPHALHRRPARAHRAGACTRASTIIMYLPIASTRLPTIFSWEQPAADFFMTSMWKRNLRQIIQWHAKNGQYGKV